MLTLALLLSCSGTAAGVSVIREPAHAGAFYPGDSRELRRVVKGHIEAAEVDSLTVPRGLVVPHAGYAYSGRTAGYAYRILRDAGKKIRRVVLLAPTHYAGFSGVIVNERTFRTPLGMYRLDRKAIGRLKAAGLPWTKNEIAETREHSDEVQVPFLQTALPQAKLVPILVGDLTPESLDAAARAISAIVDETTVILASSDFTHYGARFGYTPEFESDVRTGIYRLDRMAVEIILHGDVKEFESFLVRTKATICGRNPIRLMLRIFEINSWPARGRLLHYATSGDMTNDFDNSVSYAAISTGSHGESAKVPGERFITEEEERTLLKLARHVLDRFVNDGAVEFPDEDLKDFTITDALRKESGVFVTLRKKEALRGCIGHIRARRPLYRAVIENTMNAAARDPRFARIESGEYKDIHIDISVMSPLKKVARLDEIVVGRDGLVLTNGSYSGVFLPQVPVDQHWDKTMYLEQLGLKARLRRDAYKQPGTELHRFTAQVFEEK